MLDHSRPESQWLCILRRYIPSTPVRALGRRQSVSQQQANRGASEGIGLTKINKKNHSHLHSNANAYIFIIKRAGQHHRRPPLSTVCGPLQRA